MRILAIMPANDSVRFEKGSLFKGNGFFRIPNVEVAKLYAIGSQLIYMDERVEEVDFEREADGVLIYTEFGTEIRLREIALSFRRRRKPVIFFGPLASLLPERVKEWADSVVIGDITLVWEEVEKDIEEHRLKPYYHAPREPRYIAPRMERVGKKGLYKNFQPITAIIGCFCNEDLRKFCPYWLYYRRSIRRRDIKRVIEEVDRLPLRRTFLMDDDIASYPEYYLNLFKKLSYHNKEWVVQASKRIFSYPKLIKALNKGGVRVVYIKEGWLEDLGRDNLYKRQKEVQLLHSNRLLVGARIRIDRPLDFLKFYDCLYRLRVDFVEIKTLKLFEDETHRSSVAEIITLPEKFLVEDLSTGILWVKNKFYSLSSILIRGAEILPQVGLYNTIFYFFKYNFSYRQNFLEDIPYPP